MLAPKVARRRLAYDGLYGPLFVCRATITPSCGGSSFPITRIRGREVCRSSLTSNRPTMPHNQAIQCTRPSLSQTSRVATTRIPWRRRPTTRPWHIRLSGNRCFGPKPRQRDTNTRRHTLHSKLSSPHPCPAMTRREVRPPSDNAPTRPWTRGRRGLGRGGTARCRGANLLVRRRTSRCTKRTGI